MSDRTSHILFGLSILFSMLFTSVHHDSIEKSVADDVINASFITNGTANDEHKSWQGTLENGLKGEDTRRAAGISSDAPAEETKEKPKMISILQLVSRTT
jgi:hypothetical protein